MTKSGATVLGINSLDNSEAALEFVDELGVTFPSLRDGDGDFADRWGAAQLPESFLLDRDGQGGGDHPGPGDPGVHRRAGAPARRARAR